MVRRADGRILFEYIGEVKEIGQNGRVLGGRCGKGKHLKGCAKHPLGRLELLRGNAEGRKAGEVTGIFSTPRDHLTGKKKLMGVGKRSEDIPSPRL